MTKEQIIETRNWAYCSTCMYRAKGVQDAPCNSCGEQNEYNNYTHIIEKKGD